MHRIRKHMSFANVMSVAAVFIALGGGAYAINVGKNAIKTKNIKNNAVTTSKIANSAVTTAKIANSAVSTDKIANNAVTGPKVKDAVTTALDANTGNCTAATTPFFSPTAWMDSEGIVHLQGGFTACSGGQLVVLPTQFRPSEILELSAACGPCTAGTGSINIMTDGVVNNTSGILGGIHHLDGVSYRP